MASKRVEEKTKSGRSRRELLVGAGGALGLIVAESVAKAPAAQATQGEALIAGEDNTETSLTSITNTHTAGSGLLATGAAGSPSDSGGWGVKGVGGAGGGIGVFGQAGDDFNPNGGGGTGVLGQGGYNGNGIGVRGLGGTPDGFGVQGTGQGTGAGLVGQGGYSGGTGVVGFGGQGGGDGVHGEAIHRTGVGVVARGVGGGAGLRVIGAAMFSRSGLATVLAGSKSAQVTGIPLTSASLILAVVQQSTGGTFVKSAVPDVANSKFTINLNKAPSVNVAVGWFVVN